jgi:acetyl/propionyl-CoA carboxylase alpha subunit
MNNLPRSLFIANRGEIARRIARTCRRLNIKTVGVYTPADLAAPHRYELDQAVLIDSYLAAEEIISVAIAAKAEMLHPGYGFLAENADFADSVRAAGLNYIGASGKAIRTLGNKISSRELAQSLGVNTPFGFNCLGGDFRADFIEAQKLGFPLMIKSAAGGGGRGMRRVYAASDFIQLAESASKESKNLFLDESVYVEKLLLGGRHIEVQLLGDQHGFCTHLGERDCSLQRLQQKVIEEAPAANLAQTIKEDLYKAALMLCTASGYYNAGTAEFILTPDGNYYFLEVNTRLQVEHTVTEELYGIDLVELQILIAAGAKLESFDLMPRSISAIQARVCAEIPEDGFKPATGRVLELVWPTAVRVDAGIEVGTTVSPTYDSLIAKFIAVGKDRFEAITSLLQALSQFKSVGLQTNARFLINLLSLDDFSRGNHDLETVSSFLSNQDDVEETVFSAFKYYLFDQLYLQRARFSWVNELAIEQSRVYSFAGVTVTVHFAINYQNFIVGSILIGNKKIGLAEYLRPLGVVKKFLTDFIEVEGNFYQVFQHKSYTYELGSGTALTVCADLPGVVKEIAVKVGDKVAFGSHLITLESMKMEYRLTAKADGVVIQLLVGVGSSVKARQQLVTLDSDIVAHIK